MGEPREAIQKWWLVTIMKLLYDHSMHYGSPLHWITTFAAIFQGNNFFRSRYLGFIFTFDIYLGTNWIKRPAAQESKEILKGWWKDVFLIFGMSWMFNVIMCFETFAPWMGPLTKELFWSLFLKHGLFGLCAKFQCYQLCQSWFLSISSTCLTNIWWGKFTLNLCLGQFFTCPIAYL